MRGKRRERERGEWESMVTEKKELFASCEETVYKQEMELFASCEETLYKQEMEKN